MDNPTSTLGRLHIHHAQWGKHLLLNLVDVFAKCPEVYLVRTTSVTQMIDKSRKVFATHGVPMILLSDNRPFWFNMKFL